MKSWSRWAIFWHSFWSINYHLEPVSLVILLLVHIVHQMCPFHIPCSNVFPNFLLLSFSPILRIFLSTWALPLDSVLPERVNFAIRLENSLVSLETDRDFTYSAMHMINEEQVTLLLCFQSTCLSLIQECDNENGNYYYWCSWIAEGSSEQQNILNTSSSKEFNILCSFWRNGTPSKMTTTLEHIFKSLPWKLEIRNILGGWWVGNRK